MLRILTINEASPPNPISSENNSKYGHDYAMTVDTASARDNTRPASKEAWTLSDSSAAFRSWNRCRRSRSGRTCATWRRSRTSDCSSHMSFSYMRLNRAWRSPLEAASPIPSWWINFPRSHRPRLMVKSIRRTAHHCILHRREIRPPVPHDSPLEAASEIANVKTLSTYPTIDDRQSIPVPCSNTRSRGGNRAAMQCKRARDELPTQLEISCHILDPYRYQ